MEPLITIVEAAARIRQKRLAPVELVEQCLERIERFEPQVRAWVLIDAEGARETALRHGERIGRGDWRGPLDGIPLGVKDIADVEGWPTRAGSPVTDASPAAADAFLVARLRAAGAILLGKTVTTEFASFDPPVTRNPWNTSRTPGGSSSGSAAAVALGMCLGAIGSQTGGSITRPASYCGVAGCKPTLGRVSTTGWVPLAFHLDHPGPLARSVADLAAMLDTIAGYDPRDPVSRESPAGGCLDACRRDEPPRLALVEQFFMDEASPEVGQATSEAVEKLRRAGAEVSIAKLPGGFSNVHRMHRRIMAVEAAQYHRPRFALHRDQYGPHIRKLIEEGLAMTAVDYAEALAHQQRFCREMLELFDGFDALATPATDTTAPGTETTGSPRFQSPWSYSGLPTVSLPCGLASDGLPSALQLIGRPLDEAALLGTAAWCERQVGFGAVPRLFTETT